MLEITWSTVRLFLHVLGATVWVGGQITVAYLLPTLRGLGENAPRTVAARFNQVAWAGFALLLVTGVWSLLVIDVGDRSTEYHATLGLKLLAVGVSVAGVAIHVLGRSKAALAVGGALGALGAFAALFLGVLLHG
jgi:putative copper export protein